MLTYVTGCKKEYCSKNVSKHFFLRIVLQSSEYKECIIAVNKDNIQIDSITYLNNYEAVIIIIIIII